MGGTVLGGGMLDLLLKWRGNWGGLAAQKGIAIEEHIIFLTEGMGCSRTHSTTSSREH